MPPLLLTVLLVVVAAVIGFAAGRGRAARARPPAPPAPALVPPPQARVPDRERLRSQDLESIGRMAGGIAHDFRNLLTAISAYADLAATSIERTHPAQEDLSEIRLTTERATKLVRQLLAFARREPSEPRVLDLNALVADLADLLRRLLGDRVTIATTLAAEPSLVRADPAQVEQVLVNLAMNARDAMPDGGRLAVGTATVRVAEHRAMYGGLLQPGSYVQLAVADTGVGMDEDMLLHVFEPFYSTKRTAAGSGLGLATCWGIVTQNGGRIDVTSAVGQGTTFTIYLPCTDARTAPNGLIQLPRGDERVLVAEDDPETRRLVVGMLESHGYTVDACNDGEAALERAADFPPALVVTDLVMPRLGGTDLVKRLRQAHPDLPAVFMSGFEAPPGFGEPFLAKPFTASQLLVAARTAIDGAPTR